ncbi:hypothetical protein [Streptomyces sp. NPDC059850]|uniref:hypothetical protein n=1 Tax=Streptomyces sp. NPDC059850 TaxID=3346970 RepID=UPI003666ED25
MSEPTTPKAAPAEADAMTALLRAVHDALDLPLPGLTEEDEQEHARLLPLRASRARIVLAGVLERGLRMETAAEMLSQWTAAWPVTYTPWNSKGDAR